MMYGCGYPICMPNSNDNSGFGSGWVWAIIIVIFLIFFCTGNNRINCGC